MKAFFHALRGEYDKKDALLSQVAGSTFYDVEVLKGMFARMELNMKDKVPVFNGNQFSFLQVAASVEDAKAGDCRTIKVSVAPVSSVLATFDSMLMSLVKQLDDVKDLEDSVKLDCSEFAQALDSFPADHRELFEAPVDSHQAPSTAATADIEERKSQSESKEQQLLQAQKEADKNASKAAVTSRRGLRRKPDFTE